METEIMPADGVGHAVESRPVTFPRVVKSEWVKFRSLRSTWTVLGGAALSVVIVALLVAYNITSLHSYVQANDLAASGPLQGYSLGMFLTGALGVLFVTGEYGTGMIRATLTAVPKRLPVLWAKLVVFVIITALAMIAASFVAFVTAEAFISLLSHPGHSLGDPGALRVVIGTAVFLTLVGVFGAALGWIVRSTPGALVTFFAILAALPVVFEFFGRWGKTVAEYLPLNAGGSFIQSIHVSGTLAPWTGLLVLVLWVVATLAIAAVSLRRRDA
jgi:ABC-2 type transport system permease protein